MAQNVTVDLIKHLKANTSWEIQKLLQEFCETTGCNVTNVSITLEQNEFSDKVLITDVKITVEL